MTAKAEAHPGDGAFRRTTSEIVSLPPHAGLMIGQENFSMLTFHDWGLPSSHIDFFTL